MLFLRKFCLLIWPRIAFRWKPLSSNDDMEFMHFKHLQSFFIHILRKEMKIDYNDFITPFFFNSMVVPNCFLLVMFRNSKILSQVRNE